MKKTFIGLLFLLSLFLNTQNSFAEIDGTKYVEPIILSSIFTDYRSCLKREPSEAELVKHYADYQKDRNIQALKDSICGASRLAQEQQRKDLIRSEVMTASIKCLGRNAKTEEVDKYISKYSTITLAMVDQEICNSEEAKAYTRNKKTAEINEAFLACVDRNPTTTELTAYLSSVATSSLQSQVCSSAVAVQHKKDLEEKKRKEEEEKARKEAEMVALLKKQADEQAEKERQEKERKEREERESLLKKAEIVDPIQARNDITKSLLEKPTKDAENRIRRDARETDQFVREGIEPVTDQVRQAEDLVRRDAREADQFVREGLRPLTDLVRREQEITKQILDIPINGVKKAFNSLFGGSDEPRMSKKEAESVVIEVYKKCLKRSPDASGMAEYTNRLMYSKSEKWVETDVCTSAEALEKNGGEPIVTDNTKLKTDTSSVIKRVYLECLRRNPDASGMSTYSRMLANGKSESWLKKELCNQSN